MKVNELQVEANKSRRRDGRGIAAGRGKTAGRGTKGQNSRTGSKGYATFMGGQGPLMRRVPKKHGFKSLRVPAQVVYTDVLNSLEGKVITNHSLAEHGYIASPYHAVKIIVRGEITAKLEVKVQSASAAAKDAIHKAGGTFEAVEVPRYPESSRKSDRKEATDKK